MTGRPRLPRVPLQPLLEFLERDYDLSHTTENLALEGPNISAACRLLGVSRALWQRWIWDGITFNAADKLAVRLGHHPIEIWGDHWTALDPQETP